METDDALTVRCELVEQGLAHRRSTLRIMNTSASTGAPGSPIRRDRCAMVISVVEAMSVSTSIEDMDAIFQPRPHGAIAVGSLSANPHLHGGKVNPAHARLAS